MASRTTEPENPNVVLILTDDLDTKLLEDNLDSYPNIKELAQNGATFENAFVSNSLCCPSRATFLTGLYSHNTGVLDNTAPDGGWPAFKPLEDNALPVHVQQAEYTTAFYGKYMNNFNTDRTPPGWDEFEYVGGTIPGYEGKQQGLQADILGEKSTEFIGSRELPFYLHLAPAAPHEPAVPTPRHEGAFEGLKAPRPPSFNEENVADKPPWIRKRKKLSPKWVNNMDELYRNQARSMLAVDEMVGSIKETLEKEGQLDNTYIVFTSDNGYHRGHHRLRDGKRTAYEEDIRIPLIVQGPGVPEGAVREEMVLNNDFAPTVTELTGAKASYEMDGSSLVPLLHGETPPWRERFLIEASAREKIHRPAFDAVRTKNHLLVDYTVQRDELYDLSRDPYQLDNYITTAPSNLKRDLRKKLIALRDCAGASCKRAEGF